MVKTINRLEEPRLIFEEIAGRFEKIWEEAEEGTINSRGRDKTVKGKDCGRVEHEDKDAREGKIDRAMNQCLLSGFAAITKACASVPVGNSVF